MSHVVRASVALGVVALAVAVPGGAVAKVAKKPKNTVVVRTVDALPKAPTNLSRKCGKSNSATKIRTRRSSHPTKNRVRTVTTYCSGGTRTVFYVKRIPITKIVPGPGTVVTAPAPAPSPPAPKAFRLTLLHNNDGESKYGVGDSIVNYGGVTRFKSVLDRLRGDADSYTNAAERAGTEDKGTVVVSSGDNFLAGLNLRASFQRYDASNGQNSFYDALALGRIGYDAVTIGNHEYDFGPGRLAQLIGSPELAGVPFLSANTDFSGFPALQNLRNQGRIADSVIVTKGGQQIGIIGVTTEQVPNISSPGAVKFNPNIAGIVNAEAQDLTNAGVNKIIMSSHLQDLNFEKTLVKQLRNIDIVISGGGDELLANPSDALVSTNGAPDGPRPNPVSAYPATSTDLDNTTVPIVTTQGEYKYVGRLTVLFDAAGKLVDTDTSRTGPVRVSAWPGGALTNPARNVAADADYVSPEDAYLKANVTDPLTAYKAAAAANIIGTTDVALDGATANIRTKETNLGDLVADGFRFAANRTAAAEGRAVANVAFSNGGGIRTSITPAGNINEKHTFDVLPFDNVMVTVKNVDITKFKALMEHGVASLPAVDGRFPQISGFTMTVKQGNPAGSRITDMKIGNAAPVIVGGAIVDPSVKVNIATTNFTANGGDSYPFSGTTYDFAHAPGTTAFYPYQASLFDFIKTPVADGGLGGVVAGAAYPGNNRTTIVP